MRYRDPSARLPIAQASGARAAAAAPTPAVVDFPPEVYAPAGSQDFTPQDSGTVPAAAAGVSGELVLPLCVANIGDAQLAVVRVVTIHAADTDASTALEFYLRINGTNVPGFGPAKLFPIAAAANVRAFAVLVRVPPGATVAVVIRNPEARTYVAGAAFEGWSWPAAGGAS